MVLSPTQETAITVARQHRDRSPPPKPAETTAGKFSFSSRFFSWGDAEKNCSGLNFSRSRQQLPARTFFLGIYIDFGALYKIYKVFFLYSEKSRSQTVPRGATEIWKLQEFWDCFSPFRFKMKQIKKSNFPIFYRKKNPNQI